jgi:hypothetical protein
LFVGRRITYPSMSYLSRKVTSEVSVYQRRRSPSAWSALPLKVSLARHSDSVIDAVERHESRFGEKLFRGKFWRRGGFPLCRPEATARAGTLVEGLAVVVRSVRSAQAMASQQRVRAEGMFCPLYDFVFVSILHLASEECCPACL